MSFFQIYQLFLPEMYVQSGAFRCIFINIFKIHLQVVFWVNLFVKEALVLCLFPIFVAKSQSKLQATFEKKVYLSENIRDIKRLKSSTILI